jgi:polyisoprenoid-binding protein YceI
MLAVMSIAQTNQLTLRPGRWGLDLNHSSVGFSIRHLGVSRVRGRFARFDAEIIVGTTLAESMLAATVDLASVDTGNADRDAHLRSPDLFDVERRPTMTFLSHTITGDADAWRIAGDLTIGDITRPFALDVTYGGIQEFFDGTRHAGFEAVGELRRKEFGIDPALPPGVSAAMLGDVVKVELDIELLEPTDEA